MEQEVRAVLEQHVGDRLAVQACVRTLDLPADAAGSRKHHELLHRTPGTLFHRPADHQRRGEQIVVAPVRARSDERLVERDALARHVLR